MTWLKSLHPFVQGALGFLAAAALVWLSLQAYQTWEVARWVRPIMLRELAAQAQQAAQAKQAQPPAPSPSPSAEAK